jgi:AraC-like DNA-binding protein
VVQAAAHDLIEAAALLKNKAIGRFFLSFFAHDLPDFLALALQANPSLTLSRWSRERGISPEYAWHRFARVFGMAPTESRSKLKASGASFEISASRETLS